VELEAEILKKETSEQGDENTRRRCP